jgi:serine/threonine-protein kinase HipA
MRLPQEDLCQATGEPGSLKYEAEGGPGMRKIMDILLGSVRSHEDRSLFMKIQLLFWMLGAIDGHAKNFSIFHLRGGGFRMTPLYDVISIYPVVAAKQLDIERVTMAMAVLGSNRHYRWDRIVRRHWPETARQCRFDPQEFESLIEECCDLAPGCIATVEQEIPAGFPAMIADAIFSFLLRARDRLRKS